MSSLKTGYLGQGTAAKASQAQGFGTPTMLLLPYYIGQRKHKANPHSDRQKDRFSLLLEDVTCYMQRSMDAEGVIHWRSFHNLSQTHKVFCVKKNSLRKTRRVLQGT